MIFDLTTKKRKIAITGLSGSGKTAFLTSLLWHLHEFDNMNFELDNKAKITQFREVPGPLAFPFEQFRSLMAAEESRWPMKTTHDHRYVCTFTRSDQRWKQQLEFFDFPGERIADVGIALHDDFALWSRYMLAQLASDSSRWDAVQAFEQDLEAILAASAKPSQNDTGTSFDRLQQVVGSYWRLLARFALNCRLLVSPSEFMLSRHGDVARRDQPDKLAEDRLHRSDLSSRFAPLPAHLLDKDPSLSHAMHARYKHYRKDVVMPVFEKMTSVHSLIVLVDIRSLLLGGVDRYNDNRQVLQALFENMQDHSSIRRLFRKLKFWSPAVQRVAFVATKADLVRKDDLDKGRMKSLLHSMTRRVKELCPKADVRWFDCSSCVSTFRTDKMDDDKLGGVPVHDNNPNRSDMEFFVSSLPEDWPDDWDPDCYQFPDVAPRLPRNRQRPPRHRNLDAVFDFVAK